MMSASDLAPPTTESVCVGHVPRKTLSHNAHIRRTPELACITKQGLAIINPSIGHRVAVHNKCPCNELIALTNRHLIDRSYIRFDGAYFEKYARDMSRRWNFELDPMPYSDFVRNYKGRKRRLYNDAHHNLVHHGLDSRDFHIKMFIKQDKYAAAVCGEKAPRAIQARSPKYNLALGSYLHVFEKHFYSKPGYGPTQTRAITKGLNTIQIAQLFLEKAAAFTRPLFVMLDAAKFDSTVRVEHLRAEHRVYLKCFRSKFLRYLLSKQIKNTCFTRSGFMYTIKGTRMSGDYNTGLGNSLLSEMTLTSFVMHIKHELLIDGDDSVLIIEKTDFHKLDMTHFEKMGFEMTVEYTENILDVTYCRSKLVMSNPPVLCRDPCRAISNSAVSGRFYHPTQYRAWYSGVAACNYYTHPNMPIYCAYKDFIGDNPIYDPDTEWTMANLPRVPLGDIARVAFAETWGISPQMQIEIEQRIRRSTPFDLLDRKQVFRQYVTTTSTSVKQQTNNTAISQRFLALHACDYQFWHEFSSRCGATTTAAPTTNSGSTTTATTTAPVKNHQKGAREKGEDGRNGRPRKRLNQRQRRRISHVDNWCPTGFRVQVRGSHKVGQVLLDVY